MFPPFPQELARHYCQKIISDLQDGLLNLKQLSQISQERQGHGVMIGCLVCYDKITGERVILQAVSGVSMQLVKNDAAFNLNNSQSEEYFDKGLKCIIVPAIVSNTQIEDALKENDEEIHRLTDLINEKKNLQNEYSQLINELCSKRTKLTDESLKKVFSLYKFTRFDGKEITLDEVIEKHNGALPPTGTGDCCGPKLLSFAFSHNLQPISMDEVFYGRNTKNKINGKSYNPCDERCGYILPYILGLDIIYRDKEIIVVDKPSGLLSVPGKSEENQDCVVNRVKALFPDSIDYPSVHRLDMETSGLLVLAFTKNSHAALNKQFELRQVQKKYCALLDGILERSAGENSPKHGEEKGIMKLKFRLDVEHRPYQVYDSVNGNEGVTEWEKAGTVVYENPSDKKRRHVTKVYFTPHTGRTHQLRLAASDIHGFGLPIIGDSLYGKCEKGQRLMLKAFELSFKHPVSNKILNFKLNDDEF